jgi:hypothetical protein
MTTLKNGQISTIDMSVFFSATFQLYSSDADAACFFCAPCRLRRITTLRKSIADADTLVLDPPRAGLKNMQGFFENFVALETIYYISCDPETFARDAWTFTKKGWSIAEVQLIDLFPHTPHIETLAVLRK